LCVRLRSALLRETLDTPEVHQHDSLITR